MLPKSSKGDKPEHLDFNPLVRTIIYHRARIHSAFKERPMQGHAPPCLTQLRESTFTQHLVVNGSRPSADAVWRLRPCPDDKPPNSLRETACRVFRSGRVFRER